MLAWDPKLYLKFADERVRPSEDLAAHIKLANPRTVIDLGCGPGNSTAVLRKRWPNALVTGLDADAAMLAAAKSSDLSVTWVRGDLNDWSADGEFDIVFSNSALHWLSNQADVLPRLFTAVSVGGALAFQVPYHGSSKIHHLILEVADNVRWRDRLFEARAAIQTHPIEFYYDILCLHTATIDLWETDYWHIMSGPEAILEWIRGTGLRPYLEALENDSEREAFQNHLRDALTYAYPRQRDNRVLFKYRRQFVVAYR